MTAFVLAFIALIIVVALSLGPLLYKPSRRLLRYRALGRFSKAERERVCVAYCQLRTAHELNRAMQQLGQRCAKCQSS